MARHSFSAALRFVVDRIGKRNVEPRVKQPLAAIQVVAAAYEKTIGFPSVNSGLRRSLAPRQPQRSFGLDESTKFRRNMTADELLFGDT